MESFSWNFQFVLLGFQQLFLFSSFSSELAEYLIIWRVPVAPTRPLPVSLVLGCGGRDNSLKFLPRERSEFG